ncbi:hypothetical protein QR680_010456 [Steinernema hermaphroditum]|uniref:Uncharacterized protein n=1 Tax=Steinernema hermaphroditum TaxID=289476 RepID=A0AA39IRQ8_9BILA|nr:hypothetical protein QR680_010456 [Steinernema hermaphroditum]
MKLSLVVASCALLASLACAVPYGPFFYGMSMEYRVPRYPYPISGYGRPVDPYYDEQGYPMEYYDGRRFKSLTDIVAPGAIADSNRAESTLASIGNWFCKTKGIRHVCYMANPEKYPKPERYPSAQ